MIWQGDTANASPNYSARRGLVGSSSQGIPQTAFQGVELEVGAATTAYQTQFLPIYNDMINDPSPAEVSGFFIPSANGYTLIANVALEADLDYANNKVVFIITREQSTEYFCSVVAYGDMPLPISTAGQSGSYSMELAVNSAWDPATLKGIVMIQSFDNAYPYIYQAAECGSSPVTTTGVNFGDAFIGGVFENAFSVINIDSSTAQFNVTITGAGFMLLGPSMFTMQPGEQQDFTVTFTPTVEQTYNGNVNVTSNIAGFESIDIPLTGYGFVDQAPIVDMVSLTGIAMQNEFITASYNYYDLDGDTEGPTVVQWWKSMDGTNWEEFTHNSNDPMVMQITADYIGYMIKFSVLPYDEHGMPGDMVESNATDIVIPLQAPWGLTYDVVNDNDIILHWENPLTDDRSLFGYRLFRNGASYATIPSANTLTYTDVNLADGTYEYYVSAIYNNPLTTSSPSNSVFVTVENGTVGNDENVADISSSLSNAPNPFSAVSNISFSLKAKEQVKVEVYNLKGQLINTLVDEVLNQGGHSIAWNGTDSNNRQVPNGVYFYRVTTPNFARSMKTIYMK
ncbi:MAG: T9SS type A sorting domain-containing protein [Candidatus Cloacimonetes bacterium]|nr:T9SS type A sorting domain-containing protein [Candidatus Cloacimonadota bacterium]